MRLPDYIYLLLDLDEDKIIKTYTNEEECKEEIKKLTEENKNNYLKLLKQSPKYQHLYYPLLNSCIMNGYLFMVGDYCVQRYMCRPIPIHPNIQNSPFPTIKLDTEIINKYCGIK
jgi:hypothetical protein